MKRWILLIIILCNLLLGCQVAKSNFQKTEVTKKFPSVDPESVVIFRSSKPSWQYEEIGKIFEVSNGDIVIIFKKLREKAGAVGANGIINFDISSSLSPPSYKPTRIVNGIITTGSAIEPMPTTSFHIIGILIHKTEETK